MIRFVSRFKYIYVLAYGLILYGFLIIVSPKEHFFRRSTVVDANQKQLLNPILAIEEKKIFLDFKYKKQVHPYLINKSTEDLIFVDKECRVLGCKSMSYEEQVSTKFSFYLNKKLLNSFLFGSIKFIKL
jgi:hypothetical protein